MHTPSNSTTLLSDFHCISDLFQGLAPAVKVDLVWPPIVRSGLLALRLLQTPARSLISGRARVSQWLWTVTLPPTASPKPQVGAEPLQWSSRKQFQVDALRTKHAGHGRGGTLGERAWQGGVAEQMSYHDYDKGCWEYSEAEDVCNTHRSSHAHDPETPINVQPEPVNLN